MLAPRATLALLVLQSLTPLGHTAESPRQQAKSEGPPKESILRQIKKSVVFIVGTSIVNGVPTQTAATGFLIFVPEPRLGKDQGYVWLVTCKHVLRQQLPDGSQGPYFRDVMVRINTKNPDPTGVKQYDWARIAVTDQNDHLLWFTDTDDATVDLAITQVHPDESAVDATWIPLDILLTKDHLKNLEIDENDEVLFAGLFAWDPGARKNYPIVRHGKIALIPEERVPLLFGHPESSADVYLAEITSYGGNSGSPVFLRLGGLRETLKGPSLGGFSYRLLGVMQGFFPEASPVAVEVNIARGVAGQNSGIAIVVPAEKILHILESPRTKSFVDDLVERELKQRSQKRN